MPRLTKEQNALANQFGFVISEPPEIERTRAGKNDELWNAAKEFCQSVPNKSVMVHRYNTKAAAATDSRNINNGGGGVGRFFRGNLEGGQWLSVIRPALDENGDPIMSTKLNRSNEPTPMFDLYLKFLGE